MSYIKDFNKANKDVSKFLSFINDLTSNGSKIIEIETSDNDVLQMFDKYSGVDAIQVTKDNQLRGVAMRVQYGKAWNTFTIRYKRSSGSKTEYEKRVDAIENEKMYPQLTVQCFLSSDSKEILSVGIIRTKDLYDQLKDKSIVNFRQAKEDGNTFIWTRWQDLKGLLFYLKDDGVYYNGKNEVRRVA